MIYVKTDETSKVVYTNCFPFDSTLGLGKTEEELLELGYLVSEVPEPEFVEGKSPVLYFDGNTFNYIYQDIPISTEDKIRELEIELKVSKEDNVSNMLAITELYELILGGGA